MTELSPATAPPLRTDDDVARRVAALIGCATGNDKLWLLFVDGDDRQAPVVVPVEEMPGPPDGEVVTGLGDVLEGFLPELATAAGAGSVVFVRERLGPDFVLPADRAWAEALARPERRVEVGGLLRLISWARRSTTSSSSTVDARPRNLSAPAHLPDSCHRHSSARRRSSTVITTATSCRSL